MIYPTGNRTLVRAGMTLIELLTVMMIILIIASSITVAFISLQSQGPEKGTKALLEQLSVALEAYKSDHGMYVPQVVPHDIGTDEEGAFVITMPWQLQMSTECLWAALEGDGNYTDVKADYKENDGLLPLYTKTGKWYFYRDAWKNPLYYRCCYYINQDLIDTHYELRSAGKDLIFNTADDIVKEN